MSFNRALIPVYLNNDMLNNLFSVVVQEYVETKGYSSKDTVTIHLRTPLSEFSFDLLGKYIQGDADIQIQNEFIKQKTEETISSSVVVLKKLTTILQSNNILKNIASENSFDLLEENDYVEFSCILEQNPYLTNIEKAINLLELDEYIGSSQSKKDGSSEIDKCGFNPRQMLSFLKNSLDNYKNCHCLKYIGSSIERYNKNCIISLKPSCFLDNEDYLLNGTIRVFGKIVKKFSETNMFFNQKIGYNPILNNSLLSYIDYSKINNLIFPYLLQKPIVSNTDLDLKALNPYYDILPIVIYI